MYKLLADCLSILSQWRIYKKIPENQSNNDRGFLAKINRTHSAMTVFPAEVWADTRTDCMLSIQRIASVWNESRTNLYSRSGGPCRGCNGWYSVFGGIATSCMHEVRPGIARTSILWNFCRSPSSTTAFPRELLVSLGFLVADPDGVSDSSKTSGDLGGEFPSSFRLLGPSVYTTREPTCISLRKHSKI